MDLTSYTASPSLGGGTLPTTAGTTIRGPEWGIDNVLTAQSTIIQSESISKSRITDPTQDQKGAVVSELDYDEREDLNLTFLCDTDKAPCLSATSQFQTDVGDVTFEYAGRKWKVDTLNYTGGYASKKQYSLTGHKYKNFPAQS